jgi:hypothetical protein
MSEWARFMRQRSDRLGVVFDLHDDQWPRFFAAYTEAQELQGPLDFIVEKCLTLPDLIDEDDRTTSWRTDNSHYGGGGNYNR